MSASTRESERYALRDQLTETLGSETAGKLMEHVPPVKWEELATKDDLKPLATKDDLKSLATKDELRELATTTATKDELRVMGAELRAEMREGFAEVKESIAELKGSIAEVKGSIADVKDGIAEHRERIIVTMTGQHRMTMLTLVGLAVSLFIILLMNSPT